MSQTVMVSLGGQQVPVIIEGGNMGNGASVGLQELNIAVGEAKQAATDAEASAAQASTNGAAAGATAGASAGSASGAISGDAAGTAAANLVVVNKVNLIGDNISPANRPQLRDAMQVNINSSPEWFGAAGDGVSNDMTALIDASASTHNVRLDEGRTYLFGSSPTDNPSFYPEGPGKLKWSTYEIGGYTIDFDINNESVWSTPDSWFMVTRAASPNSPQYPPFAPPGRGDLTNIFNTVVSQRSTLRGADLCQNVTAFGSNIGVRAKSWAFTDAFGADAMMFAYRSNRNSAFGTETMVWLGAPDRQYLIDTNHDFYRTVPPNQWTPANYPLEAVHPGIGQRIWDYSNYTTTDEQVSYNTAVGRDALCHLTRGQSNNAMGYQSGFFLFEGSENVYLGNNAGRYSVFGSNNTGIGNQSLRDANDSNQATAIGYGAIRTAKAAQNATAIGFLSGDGPENATSSILLGAFAGKGHSGSLEQRLVIANAQVSDKNPIIQGDLSTGQVGINTPIGAERTNLHVRDGAGSGGSSAREAGILVEGGGVVAVSLESPSGTVAQALNFGTPANPTRGRIEFTGSGQMVFKANDVFRWRIDVSGNYRPEADNATSIGTAAQRVSVVYAGTGTINTSDARLKTDPEPITDIVLDAWGDVDFVSYKWLGAVASKGENARTHFGVIAQQVKAAFEAHGLDATRYGLLCYDEWQDDFDLIVDDDTGDQTGKRPVQAAGNRWGVRMDQCLVLEAAYQRRKISRIEERIAKLENAK